MDNTKQYELDNFGAETIEDVKKKSDQRIEIFLALYFLFGIGISFFYDTWLMGLVVGASCLLLYFVAKKMLYSVDGHHYVASLAVGIFMAQFIYQMHGLFEMHFFAFIGSALMITYQNWKTQIPLTIFIVAHHGVFGYIQYSSYIAGEDSMVYFTQLQYMDLSTFVFHVTLAAVIFFICGLWAYDMRKRTESTIESAKNMLVVAQANDDVHKNLEYAAMLSNGIYDGEIVYKDGDFMGEALKKIQQTLINK
jgi:hypothetical protein